MALRAAASSQGYNFAKVLHDELKAIDHRRRREPSRADDVQWRQQHWTGSLERLPSVESPFDLREPTGDTTAAHFTDPPTNTGSRGGAGAIFDVAWDLALFEMPTAQSFVEHLAPFVKVTTRDRLDESSKERYRALWRMLFPTVREAAGTVIAQGVDELRAEASVQSAWASMLRQAGEPRAEVQIVWQLDIADTALSKRLYLDDFFTWTLHDHDSPDCNQDQSPGEPERVNGNGEPVPRSRKREAEFLREFQAQTIAGLRDEQLDDVLKKSPVAENWRRDARDLTTFKRLYLQWYLRGLTAEYVEAMLARVPLFSVWLATFETAWSEVQAPRPLGSRFVDSVVDGLRVFWRRLKSARWGPVLEEPSRPDSLRGLLRWRGPLHNAWLLLLVDVAEYEQQQVRATAWDKQLVGLALSGGGIRSASVNLGLLQGLAEIELLGKIDLLSTVSGGGYTGSWLSAWVLREGDLQNVQTQLKPNRVQQAQANRQIIRTGMAVDEEPEPIFHVRSYCSYLTPRLGLLTADSWTMGFILLRNWLITQLTLLPVCVFILFLVRVVPFYCDPVNLTRGWATVFGVVALVLMGLSLLAMCYQVAKLKHPRPVGRGGEKETRFNVNRLHLAVLCPMLVAALLICWAAPLYEADYHQIESVGAWRITLNGYAVGIALFWGGTSLIARFLTWLVRWARGTPVRPAWLNPRSRSRRARFAYWCWDKICPFIAGLTTGYLFIGLFQWLVLTNRNEYAIRAVFGPPMLLVVCVAAAAIEVVLQGRQLSEAAREWWASVSARVMMYVVGWLALFGISLYASMAIHKTGENVIDPWWQKAGGVGAVATWILTSLGGVVTGRTATPTDLARSPLRRWYITVAPLLFLFGLVVALSWMVDFWILRAPLSGETASAALWPQKPVPLDPFHKAWPEFMAFFVVGFALTDYINPNLFSLHAMYANRLIRCFLGASRGKSTWTQPGPGPNGAPTGVDGSVRQENEITGFDFKDDFQLHKLNLLDNESPDEERLGINRRYTGPHLLVNTTLNLVAGNELALQERKADSFVLTSMHAGSASTGYANLSKEGQLTLGRAMAISGAAVSPSMGANTSTSLIALLTIFNARLGMWLDNPRFQRDGWVAKEPGFGGLILRELVGGTNERGQWVYLSDGGHFENLGVYELIRRRCRYIVVCDAEEDPNYRSLSLATLIRNVRNDFGIRIEIDTSPLHPDPATGHASAHCAIGKIHYGDRDQPGLVRDAHKRPMTGMLIYLKTSLTGDEPTDVLSFARENPPFPQETTANQFFTQSQFESYRALGYHLAEMAFKEIKAEATSLHELNGLFRGIETRWTPRLPRFEKAFVNMTKELAKIRGALNSDVLLANLSSEIDRLGPRVATTYQHLSAERTTVRQMLSLMETAWLSLQLDDYFEHAANQGLKNVFTSWTECPTFHSHWNSARDGLRADFAEFCRKKFRLP